MNRAFSIACLALAVGIRAQGVTSQGITFYDLGTLPGAAHSLAGGVSDFGNIAAGSVNYGSTSQAFRWTPGGGMVGLGYLPGYNSSDAYAISSDGTVIVGQNQPSSGHPQAFRWTQSGGMVGLGFLGTGGFANSSALAASANGSIITGSATTAAGTRAFRWTQAGGLVSLGTVLAGDNDSNGSDISDDGSIIVGYSGTFASVHQAFRWTPGGGMTGLGTLPGDTHSQAIAVSGNGAVVVGISGSTNGSQAFRWTPAQGMTALGFQEALGLSGDGSVIVGSNPSGAIMWDAINGTREVKQFLANAGINLPDWNFASANDVSADGRVIVGLASYTTGLRAWMVVIPEPAAPALLALSAAIFILRLHHRRSASLR